MTVTQCSLTARRPNWELECRSFKATPLWLRSYHLGAPFTPQSWGQSSLLSHPSSARGFSRLQSTETHAVPYLPFVTVSFTMHFHLMLHSTSKIVSFCWVPSHVEVRENEEADREIANSGWIPLAILIPHKDFYPLFKAALFDWWNDHWSSLADNKLCQIKPHVSQLTTSTRKSRPQEVTLAPPPYRPHA